MRVITSFDDLEPIPWANGAGETTELVSLTDSQALTPRLRRWRLSIARLDRPAVFSPLPGLARTFLPIGAEVALEIDSGGSESEQRALEMSTRFAGPGQFALTLNADPDQPRFQLLRLDDDDELPYRFDAAILH